MTVNIEIIYSTIDGKRCTALIENGFVSTVWDYELSKSDMQEIVESVSKKYGVSLANGNLMIEDKPA